MVPKCRQLNFQVSAKLNVKWLIKQAYRCKAVIGFADLKDTWICYPDFVSQNNLTVKRGTEV